MATTVEKYVAKCQEVVDAKPAYVKNKSNLVECDCIGMDKYAFRECGVSFSTSGTNYSARKQVDNFRRITGTSDLQIGDVVFKAREPGDAYYDLPPRYQPGGNDYNGDLNDYYHIGTVKSVYPLRIIHMTDPTAETDDKLGKWAYTGSWKSQYISNYSPEPAPEPDPPDPGPEPQPEPTPEEPIKAVVDTGGKGKLCTHPAKGSNALSKAGKLDEGTPVEIIKQSGNWAQIRVVDKNNATWYCWVKSKYLRLLDDPEQDTGQEPDLSPVTILYTVTVPHLPQYQAEALMNRYTGATMVPENG